MKLEQYKRKQMSKIRDELRAVILAGGSGTRLWPLSRQNLPKQFLSLDGNEILLEATIDRLKPYLLPKDILVVTNELHASGEAYQALNQYEKLLEPVGRNTAPAIALAATWLQRHSDDDDPIMVVLPADHIIRDIRAFHAALEKAVEVATTGRLVTFGISPDSPNTGFGYIKASIDDLADLKGVKSGERFAEKPNSDTAKKYLEEGCYYWNSGMFVWRASAILRETRKYLPEVALVLDEITQAWDSGEDPQLVVNRKFSTMPDISIDYGVLEKVADDSSNLAVVPCEMGWSDVGSWDAVHDILSKDGNDNAVLGNVLALDCRNTLVHGNHRLIAAVGVEDICLIETADAIVVTKRGESQRVREVVEALKKKNAQEHILHLTARRPWGSYTVLEEQQGFKMKRITVNPGASLSLQRHQHRSEHWIVVSGTATVTCGEKTHTLTANQSTYIPVGSKHRLENRGKIPLQLIEVQVGEYLGEDDIERFDDHYGRCYQ